VGDSSLLLGIDRWQFSQKSWSRERDVEVMSRKRFHLVYEGEKDKIYSSQDKLVEVMSRERFHLVYEDE
jgi:hypothetical protein